MKKKNFTRYQNSRYDLSEYAKLNSKEEVKNYIKIQKAEVNWLKKKFFDLAITINCFHNLKINELEIALKELIRISKQQYLAVKVEMTGII